MNIRDMQRSLTSRLAAVVGTAEAKAMASAIIEDVKGYRPVDVVLYGDRELLPETEARMRGIADKVVEGMPLQYAIGKAKFHGRYFKVTPATLIPRPETSQLVDIIEADFKGRRDLRIFDVGTGTGCIAITLVLDLPFAEAKAIDISVDALRVALDNALELGAANIDLHEDDALDIKLGGEYDIIVSNPPYVLESERADMDIRVSGHEPAQALFVPDDDPLKFYIPIAKYAQSHLAPGGKLYFEINPLSAHALRQSLQRQGYDVEIIPDYKGASRFAICALN